MAYTKRCEVSKKTEKGAFYMTYGQGMIVVCIMMIGFVITAASNSIAGMVMGVLIVVSLLVYSVVKLVLLNKRGHEQTELLKKIKEYAAYDAETMTLTLTKCSPDLKSFVVLEKSKDYEVRNEPEKLHYGSVSVGGVTTGGTYTTGGYNYISSAKKNGLCSLNYTPALSTGNGLGCICKIVITPEMCELARKSSIASYVDYSSKTIIVENDVPLSEAEGRRMLDNLKTTGYIGNKFANQGKPTIEKGMNILDFITQDIDVSDTK